jgi:putative transcription factor
VICELCGAEVPHTKNVAIESTVLAVCSNCARFGDEVTTPVVRRGTMPPVIAQRLEARKRRLTPRDVYTETGEEELSEDFPLRIRRAREDKGWKQTDLGAKINEKVSVISQLESGAISPGDALVRKIEHALGIKLKEKVEAVAVKKQSASGSLTLGDLIKMQDKDE